MSSQPLEHRIGQLEASVGDLRVDMIAGFALMDQRFDSDDRKMDAKFDGLGRKIDGNFKTTMTWMIGRH